MNSHHRVSSVEQDFNNQADGMAHSENTSQPLSQPPLSSLNGLINKVATVAGKEGVYGLST